MFFQVKSSFLFGCFLLLGYNRIVHVFSLFSDTPTFVNGRWRTDVEIPQYETPDDYDDDDDDDDDSPLLQHNLFPENSTGTEGPVTVQVEDLQTTPKSNLLKGEGGSLHVQFLMDLNSD